jgi:hypothetical protein
MGLKISLEAVQGMARPFFEQYPGQVLFVSGCCGRLFTGITAASKCSTCPRVPVVFEASNLEEIPDVVAKIQDLWDRY